MNLRRFAGVLAVGTVLLVPNANAFWGVGDVTFDPSNYGINGENLVMLQQMYQASMKQFDRLDRMQQTIQRANEAYDRLSNLDLHQMADSLKPGSYMKNARGLHTISAARSELSRMKGAVEGNVYYIKDQLARLDDLENMIGLQGIAANNVKDASTKPNQQTSMEITAQSTSVLAALASAEEQRRQQQVMATAQDQQQQMDLTNKSLELYQSLAAKK